MPRRLPALGVAAVVAGFAVILAAWLGARDLAYVDQQFPALVAGGVAGLALVMLGAAALVVEAHRRANDRLAGQLGEAVAAAARLQSSRANAPASRPTPARAPTSRAASPRTAPPPASSVRDTTPPPAESESPARNQVEVEAPVAAQVAGSGTTGHSNGIGNGTGNGNGRHGQADSALVVPRRTLFHDPQCRLVSARTDTETIDRANAVAAGLAACRICRP